MSGYGSDLIRIIFVTITSQRILQIWIPTFLIMTPLLINGLSLNLTPLPLLQALYRRMRAARTMSFFSFSVFSYCIHAVLIFLSSFYSICDTFSRRAITYFNLRNKTFFLPSSPQM